MRNITYPAALTAARQHAATARWGWLPLLSLWNAAALALLAHVNTLARTGQTGLENAWWLALAALFVPTAARLFGTAAARDERIGLVALLGLGLYLVKVLHSPLAFTMHDEFIHWRTLLDIQQTGHLFTPNPLITVSPFYPGLQIATNALMDLTGLDIFAAGVLVLAVARLVLILALYLLAEELSESPRAAGIAALIYTANPNFLFFTAQFAYESLALAFAFLTVYGIARRARVGGRQRLALNAALLITVTATITSHHLTSYALIALLLLWSVTPLLWRSLQAFGGWYAGRGSLRDLGGVVRAQARLLWQDLTGAASPDRTMRPGETTLLAIVVGLAWLVYIATLVIGYLAPVLTAAVSELLRLIAGELPSRQLFRDHAGQQAAVWEQAAGFGSVLAILLGLPFSMLMVWRHHRANPLALTLLLAALAYPATLALRFTQAGAETSNRSSEFLFLPIAVVLAIGITRIWPAPRRLRVPLLTAWATLLFIGGVIVGTPPWGRLPAVYRVSADSRSVEPQGIMAAQWANAQLGPNNRVAADRINRLLMASYGSQRVITNLADQINVAYIYMAPQVGPVERDLLRRTATKYLVVDKRLTTDLPLAGVYFEVSEPLSNNHQVPLDPAMLDKFDATSASRVFDSGAIVIYDVEALRREP